MSLLTLDTMSRSFNVLLSFGLFCPLLLAAGAVGCSEKEALLRPRSHKVSAPHLTDCLLECTGKTFKKLQLRNNQTIRLQDSTEGELGEYCWSTELQRPTGERLQRAYVVLPVDITTVAPEQLEVRATDPTAATLPLARANPTAVADTCGLRYDVTPRFTAERAGASFCVQVTTCSGTESFDVLPSWSPSGRGTKAWPIRKENETSLMGEVPRSCTKVKVLILW
ncbi:hypothetical protein EYF80_036421 [Liparis tanakae]|uniref:Uncharacterized protein n=1 Tax=Liparis tanakae TaxID=230148 RepID=A0A4Z2GKP1_9TELE|nr:hypothetical protein EYF80_036421 [Liparis tanakae]